MANLVLGVIAATANSSAGTTTASGVFLNATNGAEVGRYVAYSGFNYQTQLDTLIAQGSFFSDLQGVPTKIQGIGLSSADQELVFTALNTAKEMRI